MTAFVSMVSASTADENRFKEMVSFPSVLSYNPYPDERILHLSAQCEIDKLALDENPTLRASYASMIDRSESEFDRYVHCNQTETGITCMRSYMGYSQGYEALCSNTSEGRYNEMTVTLACTVGSGAIIIIESKHLPMCLSRTCGPDETYAQINRNLLGSALYMSIDDGRTCNYKIPTIEREVPSIVRKPYTPSSSPSASVPSFASHHALMTRSVSYLSMGIGLLFFFSS